MTNKKLLKEAYKSSGVTITFLANKLGCSRNRIYSIFNGADVTANEILLLQRYLHLSDKERDDIFLTNNVINSNEKALETA